MSAITCRLSVVASALTSDPREAPRIARQLGFNGLLYDAYSPALVVPDLTGTGRREFLRVLSAQDQPLVGLQMDLGPRGLGPGADVDRQIHRIDRAMETCAALKSPLLCVELGPLPPATVEPRLTKPLDPSMAGAIIIPTAPS